MIKQAKTPVELDRSEVVADQTWHQSTPLSSKKCKQVKMFHSQSSPQSNYDDDNSTTGDLSEEEKDNTSYQNQNDTANSQGLDEILNSTPAFDSQNSSDLIENLDDVKMEEEPPADEVKEKSKKELEEEEREKMQ